MSRRLITLVLTTGAAAALPTTAFASELIGRNAKNVSLQVNSGGMALIDYRAKGRAYHVLAWGAVDAKPPWSYPAPQVKFRIDYSGGWGSHRRELWRTFRNVCRPYNGPKLQWVVKACKAPDGSYWALQSWQRLLPGYGRTPTRAQASKELRLSHWRGGIPKLVIKTDWAYRRYHHLYGTFTFHDNPVYGFKWTPSGAPLDRYARNVYVDTYNSAYGPGWERENGFLAQSPRGQFCYGFYPHGSYPAGHGEKYRAMTAGPGVAPDVYWEGPAPGPYDRELDRIANKEQAKLSEGTKKCKPN